MRHLSIHSTIRIFRADVILRSQSELKDDNTSDISDTRNIYDFNTDDKLNILFLNSQLATKKFKSIESYDIDFDHQFIETAKYDAIPSYKKDLGCRPE